MKNIVNQFQADFNSGVVGYVDFVFSNGQCKRDSMAGVAAAVVPGAREHAVGSNVRASIANAGGLLSRGVRASSDMDGDENVNNVGIFSNHWKMISTHYPVYPLQERFYQVAINKWIKFPSNILQQFIPLILEWGLITNLFSQIDSPRTQLIEMLRCRTVASIVRKLISSVSKVAILNSNICDVIENFCISASKFCCLDGVLINNSNKGPLSAFPDDALALLVKVSNQAINDWAAILEYLPEQRYPILLDTKINPIINLSQSSSETLGLVTLVTNIFRRPTIIVSDGVDPTSLVGKNEPFPPPLIRNAQWDLINCLIKALKDHLSKGDKGDKIGLRACFIMAIRSCLESFDFRYDETEHQRFFAVIAPLFDTIENISKKSDELKDVSLSLLITIVVRSPPKFFIERFDALFAKRVIAHISVARKTKRSLELLLLALQCGIMQSDKNIQNFARHPYFNVMRSIDDAINSCSQPKSIKISDSKRVTHEQQIGLIMQELLDKNKHKILKGEHALGDESSYLVELTVKIITQIASSDLAYVIGKVLPTLFEYELESGNSENSAGNGNSGVKDDMPSSRRLIIGIGVLRDILSDDFSRYSLSINKAIVQTQGNPNLGEAFQWMTNTIKKIRNFCDSFIGLEALSQLPRLRSNDFFLRPSLPASWSGRDYSWPSLVNHLEPLPYSFHSDEMLQELITDSSSNEYFKFRELFTKSSSTNGFDDIDSPLRLGIGVNSRICESCVSAKETMDQGSTLYGSGRKSDLDNVITLPIIEIDQELKSVLKKRGIKQERTVGLLWALVYSIESTPLLVNSPAASKVSLDHLQVYPSPRLLLHYSRVVSLSTWRAMCRIILTAKFNLHRVECLKGFIEEIVKECEKLFSTTSPVNSHDTVDTINLYLHCLTELLQVWKGQISMAKSLSNPPHIQTITRESIGLKWMDQFEAMVLLLITLPHPSISSHSILLCSLLRDIGLELLRIQIGKSITAASNSSSPLLDIPRPLFLADYLVDSVENNLSIDSRLRMALISEKDGLLTRTAKLAMNNSNNSSNSDGGVQVPCELNEYQSLLFSIFTKISSDGYQYQCLASILNSAGVIINRVMSNAFPHMVSLPNVIYGSFQTQFVFSGLIAQIGISVACKAVIGDQSRMEQFEPAILRQLETLFDAILILRKKNKDVDTVLCLNSLESIVSLAIPMFACDALIHASINWLKSRYALFQHQLSTLDGSNVTAKGSATSQLSHLVDEISNASNATFSTKQPLVNSSQKLGLKWKTSNVTTNSAINHNQSFYIGQRISDNVAASLHSISMVLRLISSNIQTHFTENNADSFPRKIFSYFALVENEVVYNGGVPFLVNYLAAVKSISIAVRKFARNQNMKENISFKNNSEMINILLVDDLWPRADRRALFQFLRQLSRYPLPGTMPNHAISLDNESERYLLLAATEILSLGPISLGKESPLPDPNMWDWMMQRFPDVNYSSESNSGHIHSLFPSRYLVAHSFPGWTSPETAFDHFKFFCEKWFTHASLAKEKSNESVWLQSDKILFALFDACEKWKVPSQAMSCDSPVYLIRDQLCVIFLIVVGSHPDENVRLRAFDIVVQNVLECNETLETLRRMVSFPSPKRNNDGVSTENVSAGVMLSTFMASAYPYLKMSIALVFLQQIPHLPHMLWNPSIRTMHPWLMKDNESQGDWNEQSNSSPMKAKLSQQQHQKKMKSQGDILLENLLSCSLTLIENGIESASIDARASLVAVWQEFASEPTDVMKIVKFMIGFSNDSNGSNQTHSEFIHKPSLGKLALWFLPKIAPISPHMLPDTLSVCFSIAELKELHSESTSSSSDTLSELRYFQLKDILDIKSTDGASKSDRRGGSPSNIYKDPVEVWNQSKDIRKSLLPILDSCFRISSLSSHGFASSMRSLPIILSCAVLESESLDNAIQQQKQQQQKNQAEYATIDATVSWENCLQSLFLGLGTADENQARKIVVGKGKSNLEWIHVFCNHLNNEQIQQWCITLITWGIILSKAGDSVNSKKCLIGYMMIRPYCLSPFENVLLSFSIDYGSTSSSQERAFMGGDLTFEGRMLCDRLENASILSIIYEIADIHDIASLNELTMFANTALSTLSKSHGKGLDISFQRMNLIPDDVPFSGDWIIRINQGTIQFLCDVVSSVVEVVLHKDINVSQRQILASSHPLLIGHMEGLLYRVISKEDRFLDYTSTSLFDKLFISLFSRLRDPRNILATDIDGMDIEAMLLRKIASKYHGNDQKRVLCAFMLLFYSLVVQELLVGATSLAATSAGTMNAQSHFVSISSKFDAKIVSKIKNLDMIIREEICSFTGVQENGINFDDQNFLFIVVQKIVNSNLLTESERIKALVLFTQTMIHLLNPLDSLDGSSRDVLDVRTNKIQYINDNIFDFKGWVIFESTSFTITEMILKSLSSSIAEHLSKTIKTNNASEPEPEPLFLQMEHLLINMGIIGSKALEFTDHPVISTSALSLMRQMSYLRIPIPEEHVVAGMKEINPMMNDASSYQNGNTMFERLSFALKEKLAKIKNSITFSEGKQNLAASLYERRVNVRNATTNEMKDDYDHTCHIPRENIDSLIENSFEKPSYSKYRRRDRITPNKHDDGHDMDDRDENQHSGNKKSDKGKSLIVKMPISVRELLEVSPSGIQRFIAYLDDIHAVQSQKWVELWVGTRNGVDFDSLEGRFGDPDSLDYIPELAMPLRKYGRTTILRDIESKLTRDFEGFLLSRWAIVPTFEN